MIKALIPAAALLLLAGCVSQPPEQQMVTCAVPVEYPPDILKKAAKELRKLPKDSVIADRLLPDYARLRAAARACAGEPQP